MINSIKIKNTCRNPGIPKKKKVKPGTWEKGYKKHTYWVDAKKLATISISLQNKIRFYVWECEKNNMKGISKSLTDAKLKIESLIVSGTYQYDLFGF